MFRPDLRPFPQGDRLLVHLRPAPPLTPASFHKHKTSTNGQLRFNLRLTICCRQTLHLIHHFFHLFLSSKFSNKNQPKLKRKQTKIKPAKTWFLRAQAPTNIKNRFGPNLKNFLFFLHLLLVEERTAEFRRFIYCCFNLTFRQETLKSANKCSNYINDLKK